MSNRPEWMLAYFRQKVIDIIDESSEEEAIEKLAWLLTHYSLTPPELAKQEVRENDDE